jgi:glycyl-tRNA synthetase alpha subunit
MYYFQGFEVGQVSAQKMIGLDCVPFIGAAREISHGVKKILAYFSADGSLYHVPFARLQGGTR